MKEIRQSRYAMTLLTLGAFTSCTGEFAPYMHRRSLIRPIHMPPPTHVSSLPSCQFSSDAIYVRGGGGGERAILEKEAIAQSDEHHRHARVRMWGTCLAAVVIWMSIGTIFYSRVNGWPLATAFFYSVDAGMSIGFCTEVAERTIRSRAFSIFYILLGASVVGGALALFVADLLEGVSKSITHEYRTMLEKDAFFKHDRDKDGTLYYWQMFGLLRDAGYDDLPDEQLQKICNALDRDRDGLISSKEFLGAFRITEMLLDGVDISEHRWGKGRFFQKLTTFEDGTYMMYIVFFLWLAMGISWGMLNQKWDPITSTHFAISALATGGLTAPPVNEKGVLPNGVAIFVGLYCLLGIPLFYLAMGHSAKLLVQSHIVDAERRVICTPLKPYEFALAKSLCSRDDLIHLSDFIVLQFLRRGLTDVSTIKLVRRQFETMDKDNDGVLTFHEATTGMERLYSASSQQKQDLRSAPSQQKQDLRSAPSQQKEDFGFLRRQIARIPKNGRQSGQTVARDKTVSQN